MNPKQKILVFLTSSELGGAERVAIAFYDCTKSVFDIEFVLPRRGPAYDKLKEKKCPTHILPFGDHLTSQSRENSASISTLVAGLQAAIYIWRVKRLIFRSRASLVYTHGMKCHLLVAIAMIGLKGRLIWHAHLFPPTGIIGKVYGYISRRADLVIGNSEAVSQELRPIVGKKVQTIYCGIEEAFRPLPRELCLKQLGLTPSKRYVGMVTTFARWKGIDIFIKAVAELIATHTNLDVIICGKEISDTSGNRGVEAELRALTNEKGISKRVHFIPFQDRPESVFSVLDVTVHASKRAEPFGRVISESRKCGSPIIATNAGGAREQISHLKDGYLIELNSELELRKALTHLLDDEATRLQLVAGGKKLLAEKFTMSEFKRSMIETLEKVAS